MSRAKQRLRESLVRLEQLTGRRTLVIVRPFDHLIGEQIEDEIVRVAGDDPEMERLDVVLESDGGDADAAYKAILVLREMTDDMRVLVPRWAKSAATLFALGADVILLRRAIAELGPLDVQVVDPRNPVRSMSALDGYQSIEYLRDYALQTQDLAIQRIMQGTRARLPLQEILSLTEDFTVDLITPIMSSVKPLDFGGWGRSLDIGKVYAEELLGRYAMAGAGRQAVRETAYRLVYGYPHHGYVIDVDEALDLGLNIESMETSVYRSSREVIAAASKCWVEVCDDDHHPEHGYCGFAPAEEEPPQKEEEREEQRAETPEPEGLGETDKVGVGGSDGGREDNKNDEASGKQRAPGKRRTHQHHNGA